MQISKSMYVTLSTGVRDAKDQRLRLLAERRRGRREQVDGTHSGRVDGVDLLQRTPEGYGLAAPTESAAGV
ncbi:hypothetical protein DL765_006493 [Monosporascus sp. GIB2]|nr:hypothetical protein DL765_006493 [Monosporascus sp. GIB2]